MGQHSHRGFETVSIIYNGEVAHQDSTGVGGVLDMVQLWVNLRAKDKMVPPGYQAIVGSEIPVVTLDDNAGTARVIAWESNGQQGPAWRFTPMLVVDVNLTAG